MMNAHKQTKSRKGMSGLAAPLLAIALAFVILILTIPFALSAAPLSSFNGSFFEGFESGSLATNNWTTSGGSTNWAITSASGEVYAGSYAIKAEAPVTVTNVYTNISTAGYSNISFSFYAKTNGLDAGEYVAAGWYNGTAWIELTSNQTLAAYTLFNFSLPAAASNNPAFAVRFRCLANNPKEWCLIDNVQVSGTATADTTPPASVTNLNESAVGYDWIFWNWTNPADSDFNHTEVWIDGVWKANVTKPLNYYNATGFGLNTTHTISTRTVDNSSNINTTWVNDTATTLADTQAPAYSNLTASPASPATYAPGQSYQFNATWTDNIAMGTVLFEFDGTNYTATNVSSTYTKTFTDLAAGNHTYRWYANDSFGNANSTSIQTYTVDKAAPAINLTLNGADSDILAARLSIVNISAALDTPSGIGIIELFENGTLVNSSSTSIFVQRNYTNLGTINWTVRYNETQNYTSATKTRLLSIIDESEPQFSNLTESPAEPVTFSPNQTYQFGATWTDDLGISNVILEFAGANYSWLGGQLNKSGDTYSRSFNPLAAGTYNYKWYANDTSGNNASTTTQTYTIDKVVTALFLTFSPSSTMTYGTNTSVSCSANNPESVPALTRNSTPVSNPDSVILAAGTYSYACTSPATQNYTSGSQSGTLTVNKAATALALTVSPSWIVLNGTETNVSCSANNGEVTIVLYRNGTNVAAPDIATLSPGSYGYTCNANSSQNYTSAAQNNVLNIIQITASMFSGTTTNWSAQNLSSISNLTLERSEYGKIIFSGIVNISSDVDFDSNVNISSNYISLNSSALPEFNRAATLYLYNLTFTNPKIIRDGADCPSDVCTKLSYASGTLVFTVTGFSAYWAAENLYCGDGSCSSGETCSSCSADCGTCPSGGRAGGGGGGGSWSCGEDWYCSEWSACSNGTQTRDCTDRNKCGTTTNRPALNQSCMSCTESWVCGEWSACSAQSIQTRYCIDQSNCGTTLEKPIEVQSCEPAPPANETKELVIPRLIEAQHAPKVELIALTIAMLFGLIGVLGLRSSQLSGGMKRVLAIAHVALVLSIAGLLIMTFAEQLATGLISAVVQAVAGNWSIAATVLGIVGIISVELALRGFKLPKLKLKKGARSHKQHPDESEKWKQHHRHSELLTRMHAFERALDMRLAYYGHALESLYRSSKHLLKERRKLKRENERLKRAHAHSGRGDKGTASVRSLEFPKITVPKITIPKLAIPRLSVPKLIVQRLSFPKLAVPKVSLPKIKITIPKLAVPKLGLPKVSMPRFRIPKLSLPELAIPRLARPKIPRIGIHRQRTTLQAQEPLPAESSFITAKDVSQSASPILDLNPAEAMRTPQRIAADKHKREAIARMRAQFGLPARIPKSNGKQKSTAALRRRQL